MISRREFIVSGQALVASAALPAKVLAAASSTSSKTADLNSLTRASFLPFVSSAFAVTSGSMPTAWFTLLSVEDLNPKGPQTTPTMAVLPKKPKNSAPRTDTYGLHFHATGDQLPQGTYDFQHPVLGKFSLFIVPSGVSTHIAIVNHLVTPVRIPAPVRALPKARVLARSESPLTTLE